MNLPDLTSKIKTWNGSQNIGIHPVRRFVAPGPLVANPAANPSSLAIVSTCIDNACSDKELHNLI